MQPVLKMKLEDMLPEAPTNFSRAELANGTLNVAGTGFEDREVWRQANALTPTLHLHHKKHCF